MGIRSMTKTGGNQQSSRMFEIMRRKKEAFERKEIPGCQKKKQLMHLSKNIKIDTGWYRPMENLSAEQQ